MIMEKLTAGGWKSSISIESGFKENSIRIRQSIGGLYANNMCQLRWVFFEADRNQLGASASE